ncbi:HNH endonuclease signature motif containing protein [Actinoallomurus sp. NPDC052274]|uniref:HNH endonuclease signature motif containing protein n=1 Tax=Actinoallomurus sp. NPDC052274 TaxID=3155420 RepID=UPI003438B6CF
MREGAGQWRAAPRPVDWHARREAVLARDQVCQWPISYDGTICGSTDRLEVDHINGNTNHELWNLRALCQHHHRSRTGQQGGRAAQAKRPKRQRPPEQHPGLL